MGNVIESFGSEQKRYKELSLITSVGDGIEALTKAHQFVRRYAHLTVCDAATVSPNKSWGSSVKRKRVVLPAEHRPILVSWATDDHNLSELINLCATVERLLSALTWAKRNGFAEHFIERCHPTTGNSKKDEKVHDGDNDLVLKKKGGRTARFEITDVSGRKDTNQKINKDLKSLGTELDSYPNDDLYLVLGAPSQSQKKDDEHFLHKALKKKRQNFGLEKIAAPPSVLLHVVRR